MRRLSTIMLAVRSLLVATKTFPATYNVTLSNPINMTLTNTSATGTITGRGYPATFNVTLSNPTNATLSTATGVGTITNNPAAPPVGGAITASLSAARVTGVAPLYVNFDSTGTTSTNTTNPMHELLYVWDFGDPSSGNWVNGVQAPGLISKNTDYGPVSGHMYETPGTYTTKVTILDGVNTVTQSVTITVQDPNVVYAGNKTICFSQTADFTGAPNGATLINTAGVTDMFAFWSTYVASNKRLLFNKAQTWVVSNQLVMTNITGLHVGGFGTGVPFSLGYSGVAPTGTAVPVTGTFTSFGAIFTVNNNCSDCKFCEFVVTANSNTSFGGINYSAPQITWYKNEISGHSEGWNAYPGGVGNPTYTEFDQHCMYECHTSGTTGSAFIDDGSAGNAGGCAIFNGHTRGGIFGCYFDNANHGEQTIRLPHLSIAHLNHNYVARPNQAKNVVKIHAVDYGWMPVYTEKFVFSSNIMDLRGGYTLGTILPSGKTTTETGSGLVACNGGTSANERVRTGLFESNIYYHTRGQTKGASPIYIGGPGCTVRNNILDLWCGPGNGTDTSNTGVFNMTYQYFTFTMCMVQTSTPDPTINTAIYNNTLYCNGSNATSPMVWINSAVTDKTTIKNNIFFAPYQGYWASSIVYNPDSSTNIVSTNNTTNSNIDPKFTALPPVALTDWKPTAGSYAIGSGATVPVLQDFFRSTRSGTYSMGAIIS